MSDVEIVELALRRRAQSMWDSIGQRDHTRPAELLTPVDLAQEFRLLADEIVNIIRDVRPK